MARVVTLSLLAVLPVVLAGRPCGPPNEHKKFRYEQGDIFYEKRVRNTQQCYNLCWSTNPCVAVNFCTKTRKCSLLSKKAPGHTALSVHFNYVYGEVVMATCKSYFSPCDTRPCKDHATCISSTKKYNCIRTPTPRIRCGNAPRLVHAVVETKITMRKTEAVYKCEAGYKFLGSNNINTCSKKHGRGRRTRGKWKGLNGSCKRAECGEPVQVAQADIDDGTTHVGSTRTFTCRHDNALRGSITCQQDETWSQLELVCPGLNSVKASPDAAKSSKSSSDTDKSSKSSSDTDKSSKSSSDTDKSSKSSSDTAKSSKSSSDTDKSSKSSSNMAKSSKSSSDTAKSQKSSSDTTVPISKESGGSGTSGTSSSQETHAVDCGIPPNIKGSVLSDGSTVQGTKRTYTCETGRTTIGQQDIYCLPNGTWSVTDLKCQVSCGSYPSVDNATRAVTSSSVVEFQCMEGYTGEGDNRSVCQEDGAWSAVTFTCNLVDCGKPPHVMNATVSIMGTVVNSKAIYTCIEGYKEKGSVEIVCQPDGTWSDSSFRCSRVQCVNPPALAHIAPLTGSWHYQDEVKLTCTDKTHPSGKAIAVCDAHGQWKYDGFRCKEKEPRILVAVKDTKSFHTIEVHSRNLDILNFTGTDSIQDVDYCPKTNKLYWVEPDVIRVASLDDGQPRELFRQNGTGGFVRVDGNAELLFYAVRGTKTNLTKLNLATKENTVLNIVDTPLALEIDPTAKLVYWAEWVKQKQVMKMTYDGKEQDSVIQLGPCDLGPWAVHIDQNKNLYWSVNDEVHIRQANENDNGTVLHNFQSICDGIRTFNDRTFVSCTNDSTVRVHVNGSELPALDLGVGISGEKFITVIP